MELRFRSTSRCQRWLVVLLLAVLLAPISGTRAAAPDALYAGILPGLRDEIEAATAGSLSEYTIDVTLDPATSTLSGDMVVLVRNQTLDPLTEIVFRLYPNGDHYGDGALTVEQAQVEGRPARTRLSVQDTVLALPLASPLEPGDDVEVSLDFTIRVPANSEGTFGIFSHATSDGTWVLADWYPIIAGYDPESGWRLDPPFQGVDATFSDAAFYDVTISAPASLTVVATGTEVEATPAGETVRRRFISGPAREFALAADDDYLVLSAQAGTTRVSSYANPGDEASAQQALDLAVRAIEVYSSLFGRYPYQELDIVDTPLAGALGVSWTGIVFVNGDLMYEPGVAFTDPSRFEYLIAHEVGHQWWGGTAGANSNDHTFLTEGLTNAGYALYIEAVYGREALRGQVQNRIIGPYLATLALHGDAVVDRPIADYADGDVPRGAIDYGKAAIGFLAIRQEIGAETFERALRTYAVSYRFAIGEPDDLLLTFEAVSGKDLDDLWAFWFTSAQTTEADVLAVAGGL